MSHVMIENLHLRGVRTFAEYFALPRDRRQELHSEAQRIPFELRAQESARHYGNYEVHHAPLAYLVMAVPDWALSTVPLPQRVWMVRLFASIACVLLMLPALFALARESGLDDRYAAVCTFLLLSCFPCLPSPA